MACSYKNHRFVHAELRRCVGADLTATNLARCLSLTRKTPLRLHLIQAIFNLARGFMLYHPPA